jgi:hypothetical protein
VAIRRFGCIFIVCVVFFVEKLNHNALVYFLDVEIRLLNSQKNAMMETELMEMAVITIVSLKVIQSEIVCNGSFQPVSDARTHQLLQAAVFQFVEMD